MRSAYFVVGLLVPLTCGCRGDDRPLALGPSSVPVASPTSGEPRMSPSSNRDQQPDLGRTIALGEIVSSRVTPDDHICGDRYPFRCQYFRLPVPQDGILEVTIQWSAAQRNQYPLDMDIIGPSGSGWVGDRERPSTNCSREGGRRLYVRDRGVVVLDAGRSIRADQFTRSALMIIRSGISFYCSTVRSRSPS